MISPKFYINRVESIEIDKGEAKKIFLTYLSSIVDEAFTHCTLPTTPEEFKRYEALESEHWKIAVAALKLQQLMLK